MKQKKFLTFLLILTTFFTFSESVNAKEKNKIRFSCKHEEAKRITDYYVDDWEPHSYEIPPFEIVIDEKTRKGQKRIFAKKGDINREYSDIYIDRSIILINKPREILEPEPKRWTSSGQIEINRLNGKLEDVTIHKQPNSGKSISIWRSKCKQI